jgi:hypothetical protein
MCVGAVQGLPAVRAVVKAGAAVHVRTCPSVRCVCVRSGGHKEWLRVEYRCRKQAVRPPPHRNTLHEGRHSGSAPPPPSPPRPPPSPREAAKQPTAAECRVGFGEDLLGELTERHRAVLYAQQRTAAHTARTSTSGIASRSSYLPTDGRTYANAAVAHALAPHAARRSLGGIGAAYSTTGVPGAPHLLLILCTHTHARTHASTAAGWVASADHPERPGPPAHAHAEGAAAEAASRRGHQPRRAACAQWRSASLSLVETAAAERRRGGAGRPEGFGPRREGVWGTSTMAAVSLRTAAKSSGRESISRPRGKQAGALKLH